MLIFLLKKASLKSVSGIDKQAGFSLLEILIVLAIMGVMMTLVAPRLVSSIESVRFARTAELGAQRVSQLRVKAILEKRPIVFAPSGTSYENANAIVLNSVNMPEGWVASGDVITISATGVCSNGIIRLTNANGQFANYKFTSPLCEPERIVIEGGVGDGVT